MDQQGDTPHLLDRFAAIVGESHVLRDPKDIAPRLVENRGLYQGVSPMVLKPGSHPWRRRTIGGQSRTALAAGSAGAEQRPAPKRYSEQDARVSCGARQA